MAEGSGDAGRTGVRGIVRDADFVALARELANEKAYQEAVEVCERGLLDHPDSVDGRLVLAEAEAELGRVRSALEQIKRALLIDQENATALALMGRILLERGLYHRSVQFLTHAVKLAPNEPDYRVLLERAKSADTGEVAPVPRFGAAQVPPDDSPWGRGPEGAYPGDAATVTGGDVGPKAGLEARLAALPSVHESDDAEPTQMANRALGPRLGGSAAEVPERVFGTEQAVEEATAAFDRLEEEPTAALPSLGRPPRPVPEETPTQRPNPAPEELPTGRLPPGVVPADLVAGLDGAKSEGSSRRAPPPPPSASPPPAAAERPAPVEAAPRASVPEVAPSKPASPPTPEKPEAAAEPEKPAPKKAEASKAPEKPSPEKAAPAKPSPEKAEAAKPAPKEAEPAKKPVPDKPARSESKGRIGPVATKFVDDALFALLGRRASEAGAQPAGAGPKKRVVRTGAGAGRFARWAAMLVLAGACFLVGYAATVSGGDAAPEQVAEELKGIAEQLQRGGLASLLAAEEMILDLKRRNPELESVLDGALAETHARRFERFGGSPEQRSAALAALRRSKQSPTLERAFALVTLGSTLAEGALSSQGDSPKAYVAKARLALAKKEPARALEALTEARSRHPQHRQALLDAARLLASRGAHGPAAELLAELQGLGPLDVEVAIERYVLGLATGADPGWDEAVANLAGLVREENAHVAKDEAGRAELAFALSALVESDPTAAFGHLELAEGAFDQSPSYQAAVGRLFLALGDAGRSEVRLRRALELDPENDDVRVQLAMAELASRTTRRPELGPLARVLARLNEGGARGRIRLPFGTARIAPERFELVEVELDGAALDEDIFASVPVDADGETWAAAVETAVARRELARGRLEAARSRIPEAGLAATRAVEGQLRLASGEDGLEDLSAGLEGGFEAPDVRLALARARARSGQVVEAIEAYEAFLSAGGLSPEAWVELAELRRSRGDTAGAEAALAELAKLEPSHPAPALAEARAAVADGDVEAAEKALDDALERSPVLGKGNTASTLEALGSQLSTLLASRQLRRDRNRGLNLLRAVLERPDAPPEAHFHLGRALLERRRTRREGREELGRYLALAGQDAPHAAEATRLSRTK